MPKPQLEKTLKLKLDQIQFSTIENFATKKMHFSQILVKSLKLVNSTSFEPIFLNPKNSISKIFWILKPKKLKPEPLRGATKLEPEEIQIQSSSTIQYK